MRVTVKELVLTVQNMFLQLRQSTSAGRGENQLVRAIGLYSPLLGLRVEKTTISCSPSRLEAHLSHLIVDEQPICIRFV